MKMLAALLLAVVSQAAPAPEADPAFVHGYGVPYTTYGVPMHTVHGGAPVHTVHHPVVPYSAVSPMHPVVHSPLHTALTYKTSLKTGNSVPVAVGGYKAEAGCNGALCGPVHQVGAKVGALALETQQSSGAVKLTTGTGKLVTTPVLSHYLGKREAVEPVKAVDLDVVKPLVYGGYPAYTGVPYTGVPYTGVPYTGVPYTGVPYNGVAYTGVPYTGVPYTGVPYNGVPYTGVPITQHFMPTTQEFTYKTITPTVDTKVVATNLPVPVAVGGYKAVAGDNGELKGAVHDVPAVFGAPALQTQVNEASQGSLTVGTSAVVTHSAGKPIVNEHKVQVPTHGVYAGQYYV